MAKVFDGNMLPDGTVEVGMMRMLWVVMRMGMRIKVVIMMEAIIDSSYFLIYVDENLRVHFNIDKG